MNATVSASRVEALLRTVGIATWFFVGTPTVVRWIRYVVPFGTASSIEWLAAFALFGIAFWIGTDAETGSTLKVGLLVVQSLAALVLAIRTPEFEGALLAVVAAQMPAAIPLRVSALWASAQAIPLFAIIYPSHHVLGSLQATGAYLAFATFAMGVVYLRERETVARRELARANGELLATQRLLAENTRVAERLRIARDLHDSVGHHLTSLTVQLELARRTSDPSAPIAEASDIARALLGEVREIVSAMRSEETVDLGSALRAFAEIREPRVHCAVATPIERIDAPRALVLFRCVQESITNAIRHGNAQNVWIEVDATEDGIRVRVRDDGRGSTTPRFGNGLSGMRERLASVGGALEIATAAGTGFAVTSTIPLAAKGIR